MRKTRAKPTKRATRRPKSAAALTVTVPGLVQSGDDADFRELISLMYAAIGRLTVMRRALAQSLELSSAQFAVVLSLLRLGPLGGVKIRDIADDLSVEAANVTVTVAGLETLGWVVKTSDPKDSRALAIQLTADARKRMEVFSGRLHLVNDRWFQGTSRDDLTTVIAFFRRLIARYGSALHAAGELGSLAPRE